jgi:hypothetical protein
MKIKIHDISKPFGYLKTLPLRVSVGLLLAVFLALFGRIYLGKTTLAVSFQKSPLGWFVTIPLRIVALPLPTLALLVGQIDYEV